MWKVLGVDSLHDTISVDSFEISSLVTFGQYKEYLASVKKDSSQKFYLSQFPDSSMCAPDAYVKYVNSPEYDDYPVSGISWDNAMNFCRWKTKHVNGEEIKMICRLPYAHEWLCALSYLSKMKMGNDLNKDYSDWTLDSYDESAYAFDLTDGYNPHGKFGYIYFAKPDEPAVLKRKVAIGNSFHFCQHNFISSYFYEFHGYAYIGFRYVTVKRDKNTLNVFLPK